MDFVAIDFETADSHPESACSIGLVKMNGRGETLGTWDSLIKPPSFCHFSVRNTAIHGIRSSDVRDCHDFAYMWPDIEYFIGDSFLVAHNASFDMNVLCSLLSFYGLAVPDMTYFCSLCIARRVWPRLKSHALTSLSNEFGFEYNAHDALEDAKNCAKVFLKACSGRLNDMTDLRKFLITKGIVPRSLSSFSAGRGWLDAPSYYAAY